MRAVAYNEAGPIERPDSLIDVSLPDPVPMGRDLLVEVRAVSVNPVDYKQRRGANPTDGGPKVIGYDGAGVVRGVGSDVTLFQLGDEVSTRVPSRGPAPMQSCI